MPNNPFVRALFINNPQHPTRNSAIISHELRDHNRIDQIPKNIEQACGVILTVPRFYVIRYVAGSDRGVPWARTFGPGEDVSLLPPAVFESNREFWRVNRVAPGLHIERQAGNGVTMEWPDFLGNGLGYPSFFVSERVVTSLRHTGVRFGRLTHIPIGSVRPISLQSLRAPNYFIVEGVYGIDMDYVASGVQVEGGVPKYSRVRPPNWILDGSTWNGEDLLAFPNPSRTMSVSLICTQRIVNLAAEEKWTNCKFEPLFVSGC